MHTPRLCNEPVFLEGREDHLEPAAVVECRPIVDRIVELVEAPVTGSSIPPPPAAEEEPQVTETQVVEHADLGGGMVGGVVLELEAHVVEVEGQEHEEGTISTEGVEVETVIYDGKTGKVASVANDEGVETYDDLAALGLGAGLAGFGDLARVVRHPHLFHQCRASLILPCGLPDAKVNQGGHCIRKFSLSVRSSRAGRPRADNRICRGRCCDSRAKPARAYQRPAGKDAGQSGARAKSFLGQSQGDCQCSGP